MLFLHFRSHVIRNRSVALGKSSGNKWKKQRKSEEWETAEKACAAIWSTPMAHRGCDNGSQVQGLSDCYRASFAGTDFSASGKVRLTGCAALATGTGRK